MKRFILIALLIVISIINISCKADNFSQGSSLLKADGEEVDFSVDQILLSKSFQKTDPYTELITKNSKLKLLISIGLTESSGVQVRNILRHGNQFDIFLSSEFEEDKVQLAVPQIILEFNNPRGYKAEDLKFNIINEDPRPVKIKLALNDALNKINSHFKISPTAIPKVNLIRDRDQVYWDIDYASAIDKNLVDSPVISISTRLDANSGEVVDYDREVLSTSLDFGTIDSYSGGKFLSYKKQKNLWEDLYIYNLDSGEKSLSFSSTSKILSSNFSPDLSKILVLDQGPDLNSIYLIKEDNKKAYKLLLSKSINPSIVKWQDDSNILIAEVRDGASYFHRYSTEDDNLSFLGYINEKIDNFIYKDGYFILTKNLENNINKDILISQDLDTIDFRTKGYNIKSLDDEILYLSHSETTGENSLLGLQMDNKTQRVILDDNPTNYQVLTRDKIAYTKMEDSYILNVYKLNRGTIEESFNIISDNFIYYGDKEKFILNLSLPFESTYKSIIYLFDVKEKETP